MKIDTTTPPKPINDWEIEFEKLIGEQIKEYEPSFANFWYHGGLAIKSFIKSLLNQQKQELKEEIKDYKLTIKTFRKIDKLK